MSAIDWKAGDLKTRGGKAAEVFAESDGKLWGRFYSASDKWVAASWRLDGRYESDFSRILDLVPPPKPKRTLDLWINVYPGTFGCHKTKEKADHVAAINRIACLHVVQEYEEGEGLS